MDDLDRLYRRLVHNIRATRPEYLQIPFSVQELYEQLVPYRHNRREMGIETNQDYETAVALLLSGERGYVRADTEMQEALRKELASPTGDPGLFKEYAQAQLTLAPVADAMVTPVAVPVAGGFTSGAYAPALAAGSPTQTPAAAEVTAAYDTMAPGAADPIAMSPQVPSLLSSLTNMTVPTGCRFCGGTLPDGREVNYCPHCGENLKTKRCPACGSEMDTAWQFCVTCGKRAE
jgi:hypothetical protein